MQAYLSFNGNCAEAFAFYAQCLDGKIAISMTYEQAPSGTETPPEMKNKIMHARLNARDFVLMGSDVPANVTFEGYEGFHLSVPVTDPESGEKIFNALSSGGKITMPYATTFWSPGFGMLVDKYGVPWMVNCEDASKC